MQKGPALPVLIFAFFLLQTAAAQPSPPSKSVNFTSEQPVSTGFVRLSNGLGVQVIPDHEVPVIWIEMSFKAGTAYEKDEELGLAHLFGRTVSYIPRIPVSQLEAEDQELLAFPFDAETSPEKLSFRMLVPFDNLEKGLELLRNRLIFRPIEENRLNPVRNNIILSFGSVNNDPFRNIRKILFIRLYGPDASLRFPEGDVQAIARLKASDLESFRSKFLFPANCLLSIKGDIPEGSVLSTVQQILGDWTGSSAAPEPRQPIEYVSATEEVTPLTHEGLSTPVLFAAWKGPDAREGHLKDAICADLFCRMANYPLSRIQRQLVKNGPVNQANFEYDLSLISNPLSVSFFTVPGQENASMTTWFSILDQMENGNFFSDTQLRQAREEMMNEMRQEADQPRGDLSSLSLWWAVGGPGFRDKLPATLSNITIQDIDRFIDEYILTKSYSAAVLGPSELVSALQPQELFGLPELEEVKAVVSNNPKPASIPAPELKDFRVYFEMNSFTPDEPSQNRLSEIAEILKAWPSVSLYVDGHADTQGNASYNKELSGRRAKAIRDYLVKEYKINSKRLTIRAFGEENPEFQENSAEDLRKNRRVEFGLIPTQTSQL